MIIVSLPIILEGGVPRRETQTRHNWGPDSRGENSQSLVTQAVLSSMNLFLLWNRILINKYVDFAFSLLARILEMVIKVSLRWLIRWNSTRWDAPSKFRIRAMNVWSLFTPPKLHSSSIKDMVFSDKSYTLKEKESLSRYINSLFWTCDFSR